MFQLTTAQAHERNVAQRALVLAHPEVARRLTDYPLALREPKCWNGFVPPELWREERNDTPQRAQLLAIIAEAQRHDADGCDCYAAAAEPAPPTSDAQPPALSDEEWEAREKWIQRNGARPLPGGWRPPDEDDP